MDFKICKIDKKIAKKIIITHHYTHAWPATTVAYGAFIDRKIVGVITFGLGAALNQYKTIPGLTSARQLCELTRLWIADWAPDFVESRTIAAALRSLKKGSGYRCSVSFADPLQGHSGIVYQASNWIYLGKQKPGKTIIFPNGERKHPRSVHSAYGTLKLSKLQARFPGLQIVDTPGKHKYAYPLDKQISRKLRCLAQPYPKRQPTQRGTEDHSATGGAEPTLTLQPSPAGEVA